MSLLRACPSRDIALDQERELVDLYKTFVGGYNGSVGGENAALKSRLSETYILWKAVEFKSQTGKWPSYKSGSVSGTCDTWASYDANLRSGTRGLKGGSSLANLLSDACGARHKLRLEPLTEQLILQRADEFLRRNGKLPNYLSGTVDGTGGDTWAGYCVSLRRGTRGLPGGSSLSDLLKRHRGFRNQKSLPKLSEGHILQMASEFLTRTGTLPSHKSGPVNDGSGDMWQSYENALRRGLRGLPGGSSLFKLVSTIKMPRPGFPEQG
jgi:hypothetical protein